MKDIGAESASTRTLGPSPPATDASAKASPRATLVVASRVVAISPPLVCSKVNPKNQERSFSGSHRSAQSEETFVA
jgi:hypothetical protein